jgi:hypothetical protein
LAEGFDLRDLAAYSVGVLAVPFSNGWSSGDVERGRDTARDALMRVRLAQPRGDEMSVARIVTILVAGALTVPSALARQQTGPWVAFRYDADRVLFYVERLVDPVRQDYSRPLKPPVARYGAGGYLLPLSPDRLKTLRPSAPSTTATPYAGPNRVPAIGTELRLRLGGDVEVAARVEAYVEQWGSENPTVNVAAIAKVGAGGLAAFHAASSAYFLIDMDGRAAVGDGMRSGADWKRSEILNRFGQRGQLSVHIAEAGWCVILSVPRNGSLRPSTVEYCYGD